MEDKILELEVEKDRLERKLLTEAETGNQVKLAAITKEHARVDSLLTAGHEYLKLSAKIKAAREILESGEREIKQLASEELEALGPRFLELERLLSDQLNPANRLDQEDAIFEIRAGTGGEEAGIFAADLFRMYHRFLTDKGFQVVELSSSRTTLGGLKEVVAEVLGQGAFGWLRQEAGVHRVQRVPATEKSGRLHTSAVSIVVLPIVKNSEFKIKEGDLKIEVYRSSGKGGQHVNTTDSAVRITHLPTGIAASVQDERSQKQNREKALTILEARVEDYFRRLENQKETDRRRLMIKSGDRSDKIRTYNFPQDRATDHRVNLTFHNLESIMAGNLEEMVSQIKKALRERRAGDNDRRADQKS